MTFAVAFVVGFAVAFVVGFVVGFVVAFVVAFVGTFSRFSSLNFDAREISPVQPFTPTTSMIKRFKSEPYITAPLIIKLRSQQDGVVFMDYVNRDNFLMVIIRGGQPVVRFSHDGDLHVVTLSSTPTLVLSVIKDPLDENKVLVQGYNYVTKVVETKTIPSTFKRLTSHQIRLGASRQNEFSKSFTGDLYWIRYVDSFAAPELGD